MEYRAERSLYSPKTVVDFVVTQALKEAQSASDALRFPLWEGIERLKIEDLE
jgi:hypothetical protein